MAGPGYGLRTLAPHENFHTLAYSAVYIFTTGAPNGPSRTSMAAPSSSDGVDVPTVRAALSRMLCGGSDQPLGRSHHRATPGQPVQL